ncbi:MAG: cupin domain-containing protein [Bacteroidota bacterium]
MKSEHIDELAALNSVGALDGEDLKEFQRLSAAGSDELKKSVATYEAVAGLLPLSSRLRIQSQGLKEKIMRHVRQSLAQDQSREGYAPSTSGKGSFSSLYVNEVEWVTHPVDGVRFKQLSLNTERGYATLLFKLAAGVRFPGHHHSGSEECYVVEGDLHIGNIVLGPGDFHHAEAGSDHGESFTEQGCTLLLVVAAEDYLPK